MTAPTTPPSKQRLEPLGTRVIVVPDLDQERVTPGGLHIPEQATEKPTAGRIVAIGPDCTERLYQAATPGVDEGLSEKRLRVGQRVIYGKYAGTPIELDDHVVMLLEEKDLLARFCE